MRDPTEVFPTLTYNQTRILNLISDDPGVSFRVLATKANMSLSTAFDQVQSMRDLGVLDYDKCPTCGRGLIVPTGKDVHHADR
jgi:DNA-binding MarR family transcriptional regulator